MRVLNVEDSERDAALLRRHLSCLDCELVFERVDTPEAMRTALETAKWDVILCDYTMPQFGALQALALLKEIGRDIPFIVISGTIGEEVAVEAMRAGAHDYLMKDHLVRLVPAIEREIEEAKNRRARREAEATLRDSELELRALFAAMKDIIFVLDAQGRYVGIAPTDPAYSHKPSDDVIGKMLHEVLPWETALFGLDNIRRALRDGRPHKVEYRMEIDGAEVWFEGSVSPMSDDTVVWVARDITERKRAEQENARLNAQLESERERLTNIVANVPGVVWEAWDVPDSDAKAVDFVSDYVETMVGYSVEDWLSKANFWLSIIHPDDSERAAQVAAASLASGERGTLEFRWIAKDGHVLWVESHWAVIKDDEDRSVGLRGVTIDISDRRRAAGALRESEERYRLLFERNPQPIWVFDSETLAFLAVNEAAVRRYGYSREEFLAMTIKDIRLPEDVPALMDRLATRPRGLHEPAVWRHVKKDGTVIDVEVVGDYLIFAGRPARVALVSDVTERKLLEEQLRQAQKMEAIGQLAGGVAHDFNNLLTVIGGYGDLALRRLKPEDPLRPLVEEILRSVERAASLTRQLLAFSRKQVLQPTVLNLNSVVSDLEKMLHRLIGEDVELRTVMDPELGSTEVDPGQIEQVIMNLAVNARDAMPRGGRLTIETRNEELDESYTQAFPELKPGHYVLLAVSDTGTGMDEATKSRIFEPFFTTKGIGKGTGLGLATVYGIVKQTEGHVNVYSELGRGSTFKVYLPRTDAPKVSEARPASDLVGEGSETILLAEDEDSLRDLTHQILDMYGYRVLLAANGEEAMNIAAGYAGTIHLLVTDVVMPVVSGSELVERLSQLRPEIKVLYLSGYADDAIVRHGVLRAETAFLQKPFTPAALAMKVRAVLSA